MLLKCETFGMLSLYVDKDICRFSNLHWSTIKKVILKMLQISQKNTYVGIFFNKVADIKFY